jgi:glycosyl transferase family 2
MVRVRNEEEFLYSAVRSIIDHVEEVVLVDNLSTDGSAAIMERLRREYPEKVFVYQYPHPIRRIGRENWEYATDPAQRTSPSLSANYFNWCKDRCTCSHVLNWDGDMIATDDFYETVSVWRHSDTEVVFLRGVNVHPDREHLIAARSTDRDAILASLSVPGLPRWATHMTRDSPEARIYPTRGSRFTTDRLWTQRISTPFVDDDPSRRYVCDASGVSYLHMKFCKRDPFSNYSDDLGRALATNVTVGPILEPQWKALLDRAGRLLA